MEATQNGAVTTIKVDYSEGNKEHAIFLASDLHIDSVDCNRNMLLEDLTIAKDKGAQIFFIGDVFDAMQGRFDPRRSLEELRPEYRRNDYYDFVVADVARILSPFAANIVMIAEGNHETAVLKNSNINLTDRLVWLLNKEHGGKALHGGYGGWVRWLFSRGDRDRMGVKMKYYHGFGGDAPVTRGVIHTNRQAVYIKDADIIVNGHNHNAYYMPIVQEGVNNNGSVYFSTQHHIRVPGYKQEYGDGSGGWSIEKGMVPKPIGGFFVNMNIQFTREGRVNRSRLTLGVQPLLHDPEPVVNAYQCA